MPDRQKRAGSTVAKVLDAALEIFGETSSTQAPVSLLGERSGVSVGSIYHHFGSLEGVSAALYSRCMKGLLESIIRSIAGRERLEEVIRGLVSSYLAWTRRNPAAARFIHASAFAPHVAEFAREIGKAKAAQMERLNEILRSHVAAGRVRKLPEFLYEMLIIGPVAETARRWLASAPGVNLREAEKHLPERILESISR
jgi:AcrR family transcriptional regulator